MVAELGVALRYQGAEFLGWNGISDKGCHNAHGSLVVREIAKGGDVVSAELGPGARYEKATIRRHAVQEHVVERERARIPAGTDVFHDYFPAVVP